jgi:hypothetical protein
VTRQRQQHCSVLCCSSGRCMTRSSTTGETRHSPPCAGSRGAVPCLCGLALTPRCHRAPPTALVAALRSSWRPCSSRAGSSPSGSPSTAPATLLLLAVLAAAVRRATEVLQAAARTAAAGAAAAAAATAAPRGVPWRCRWRHWAGTAGAARQLVTPAAAVMRMATRTTTAAAAAMPAMSATTGCRRQRAVPQRAPART